MTDWRRQRLAEMDAEIAAKNAAKERNVTNTRERLDALDVDGMRGQMDRLERKFTADEQRLSAERDQRIAAEVDQKATSLMNSDPTLDYGGAMRQVLANDERFAGSADEPASDDLASAVERRMKADPEHYPSEADDEGEPVGSTHDMDQQEYQSEVQRIAKERGYDL